MAQWRGKRSGIDRGSVFNSPGRRVEEGKKEAHKPAHEPEAKGTEFRPDSWLSRTVLPLIPSPGNDQRDLGFNDVCRGAL